MLTMRQLCLADESGFPGLRSRIDGAQRQRFRRIGRPANLTAPGCNIAVSQTMSALILSFGSVRFPGEYGKICTGEVSADYGRPSAYQITKSVIGGEAPSCRILDAFWPRWC